jgi:TolA-binding protein
MFRVKTLLITFCLFTSLLAVSPDFLYNQKEPIKSKALIYTDFAKLPSHVFSYALMMKVGIDNYYLNKFTQAEKYFSKALKLARDSLQKSNSYYWLGRSFLMRQEAERASQYFAQVLNYYPNPVTDFLFFYGISLYATGHYDDAFNCFLNYEGQTKTESQAKELPLFIGATALAKGDYVLAEQYLDQDKLESNPKFATPTFYLLGLSYYLAGEKDKSLEALREVKSDTNESDFINRAHLISGTIYFERGELTKATNEFDAVTKDTINPYKEQAYLRSGISYLKQKKSIKALARFDTLLQNYPSSSLNELAIYYKAQIFQQDNKLSRSEREYRKFLASYPNSPLAEEISANLGQVLFDEENYLEAIPILEDFVKNYPKSKFRREALFNLIQSSYELNKYDKVKIYGGKFLIEFPMSGKAFDVHYKLGEIGIIEKNTSNAIKHFNAVTSGRFYPYALNELGNIYTDIDSFSLALNYYNLAEQVSTDTLVDEIRLSREKIYLKQGQYKSEMEMLKKYLEKYPQSRKVAKTQFDIGNYFLKQNDVANAIVEFDKVSGFDPTSQYVPMAEMGKAECYTKLGETEQVTNCYLRIINDFPNVNYLPQVLYSLASLYNQNQKYDSAIIFYDQLISNFPKAEQTEDALFELAKANQTLDNLNNAIISYQRFIVGYSNSKYLKESYLNLADAYKDMGKFSLAEKAIKDAFNKFGKFGDGYFKLGKINVINNKITVAKTNFLDAHDAYVKEQKKELAAVSLFEAGKCVIELKKWSEAKDLFNRCVKETQDERLRIECDNQLKLIPK